MGVVVGLASHSIETWLGVRRISRLLNVACCIPLGALTFYGAARALKVAELDMVASSVFAPALGWLSRRRDKI